MTERHGSGRSKDGAMSVSRTCLGSPNFIDGASLATVLAYRASCSPVGIAPILFSITSVSRPGTGQNTRSKWCHSRSINGSCPSARTEWRPSAFHTGADSAG